MGRSRDTVLRVDRVGQSFRPAIRGWFRAAPELRPLNDVSFSIKDGESLGIVGTGGAGKSTLLRVLLGLEDPEVGHVTFMGQEVATLTKAQRRRFGPNLRYLSCETIDFLSRRKTAYAIVAAALARTGLKDKALKQARVIEALRLVGIGHADSERRLATLSQIQCQKVALAATIVTRPRLVVVDELAYGMDVSVQAQMLNLLLEIQDLLDMSLVMSSSNLSVAGSLCDHLLVLKAGEVVETGSAHQVTNQPSHSHTYQLLSQSRASEAFA
ncbi:ABC transporter ATP-binding protein [Shimia sp. NS0008-38b]|uniref:ATP-binding cassette domain-containing protein n=1 Tax=Shimia sp. NS0008-38b TaxID=3127653 RepID=UPI003104B6B0